MTLPLSVLKPQRHRPLSSTWVTSLCSWHPLQTPTHLLQPRREIRLCEEERGAMSSFDPIRIGKRERRRRREKKYCCLGLRQHLLLLLLSYSSKAPNFLQTGKRAFTFIPATLSENSSKSFFHLPTLPLMCEKTNQVFLTPFPLMTEHLSLCVRTRHAENFFLKKRGVIMV